MPLTGKVVNLDVGVVSPTFLNLALWMLGAIVGGSEEDLLSVVEAALADTVGNVALFTVAEAAALSLMSLMSS